MTASNDNGDIVAESARIAGELSDLEGPLLPVLHAVQDKFGYIPRESVPPVAKVLNLSRAEVHGVISFYEFFRQSPPGLKTVYICRAEACQAMGSAQLEQHAKDALEIDFHETTSDGRVSLEPVYCLGNCACSPSVMVDDGNECRVYSRVTPETFAKLVK